MYAISSHMSALIASFVTAIIEAKSFHDCLILGDKELQVFRSVSSAKVEHSSSDTLSQLQKSNWDLLLANHPLGRAADRLIESLPLIGEHGLGIHLIEPMLLTRNSKSKFVSALEHLGYAPVGIFNTPKGFLQPYTAFRPILLAVSKQPVGSPVFVGELETIEQAEQLAHGFVNGYDSASLSEGTVIPLHDFIGFQRMKALEAIKKLDTEYKSFSKLRIADLATEVNLGSSKKDFVAKDNAIYIPKLGTQNVVSSLEQLSIKAQNYVQVVCDPKKVSAEYLVAFFASTIGNLVLDYLKTQSYIPSIRKAELLEAEISVPSLPVQQEILTSIRKLQKIRSIVEMFERNLAIQPIGSTKVLNQIDTVLDAVGEMSDSERVMSLVRAGESKHVEFKETFNLDVRTQTKEKDRRRDTIKTIAAFMNSSGGTLLVGVNDQGEFTGIDIELQKFHKSDNIQKSKDKFLLDFKNAIKTHIGEQCYPLIDQRLIELDGKLILCVDCQASSTAVFVDDNDFYVRTNPATDLLTGKTLLAYIDNHFLKSRNEAAVWG